MELCIPIVIPAYEPDNRMLQLARDLKNAGMKHIIIVNDGSGESYDNFYLEAEKILKENDCVLLNHTVNRGKGRALKTAFDYVISSMPQAIGVVTVDSDGQHTIPSIRDVMDTLNEKRNSLVLGVRQFDGEDIPWKSRLGNTLTMKFTKLVSKLDVQDTQTGLRGIPFAFLKTLVNVPGERFEFEMRMLLESVNCYPITQVPIETVYDSKENHQTHFNPIKDSFRIYRILFETFARYLFSSLSSFALDIVLFSIFCRMLRSAAPILYPAIATVAARILSATYNYSLNRMFVFKSTKKTSRTLTCYGILALIQMVLSSCIVTVLTVLLFKMNETAAKLLVDTILFMCSYQIQKRLIF